MKTEGKRCLYRGMIGYQGEQPAWPGDFVETVKVVVRGPVLKSEEDLNRVLETLREATERRWPEHVSDELAGPLGEMEEREFEALPRFEGAADVRVFDWPPVVA